MRHQQEKQQLKAILSDPRFQTVENLAQIVIADIRKDSCVKETEWETLKETLLQEGQQRGIIRFIQECYKQIKDL
mgnify:FL=1